MNEDTIEPATEELITLVLASRRRWTEADVRAALTAAYALGMSWEQIATKLISLMIDPHATPRVLAPSRRDRQQAGDPHRGAALVREAWPNLATRRPRPRR
ncbi:hypothetical protein ABZ470_39930 [Streptosporangium sp. NPDC020072]|uniref:hypothetical protein n=1 Tax=Streptosporangium sp. NPDC020072 TaxID=3154788 RepID=UPI003420860F